MPARKWLQPPERGWENTSRCWSVIWLSPLISPPTVNLTWFAAPLVLHYLADWAPTLREFQRVLKPGGVLVFSTHHPIMDVKLFNLPDYFATTLIEDEWDTGRVTYYHRSMTAILDAVLEAGFALEKVLEPQPVPAMQASHPELYDKLMHNPWFLVIRARRI